MTSMAITVSLPKLLPLYPAASIVRSPWRRGFVVAAANPRFPQERDGRKAAKGAGEEMKKVVEGAREMVTSASDQVVANAHDLGEKAKQAAQDAWGSAKETAEKAKDTVTGKAEETKERAKDSAESVERAMNTKNC